MKEINSLHVSESFYSIQGEGATMGRPSVFLRLSGCNLLCQSASWICDTIEVWRKGIKTPFADVLPAEHVEVLRNGAHLIITGGEPMLHDKAIVAYLKWFQDEYRFLPCIEIETNGTIKPSKFLVSRVNNWNVSPKLSSSGESKEKRFKPEVLEFFDSFLVNVIFKFVVSDEYDIKELESQFLPITTKSNWVLMPAGETQEKLNVTRPFVAEQCIKMNVRYSDRLHVVIWNQKTGV